MAWALLAAYAAIFVLLSLRYRRAAWRSMAPPALATLATLALFGLCAQPLQLFHVLACLLLLGLGVDYGIFLQEPTEHYRRFAWLTVGLSAVSALLSFGLLALSSTPPLHAFGLTMLIENNIEQHDVLIIGAGPAGAVAAALLRRHGHAVMVIEREQFPRFSIGESLLPQSMAYLEQAGMLQAVVEHGFQFKNGASFVRGGRETAFDFRDKHSAGWGTTYQVQRADFDHLLAQQAELQGAQIRYRQSVTGIDLDGAQPRTHVRDANGRDYIIESKFVLDASGFGRVLPR
eukprot:gene32575-37585_t